MAALTLTDHGLPSWGRDVLLELDKIGLTEYWAHQPSSLTQCTRNITFKLRIFWRESITTELLTRRFYSDIMVISNAFVLPPDYISKVKNDEHRVALTRLRVSSKWLSIVTGAWTHVPRDQRLCRLCGNSVGDERHFLFQCGRLRDLRLRHFGANLNEDIKILNDPLFSCQLAAYCYLAFKISS